MNHRPLPNPAKRTPSSLPGACRERLAPQLRPRRFRPRPAKPPRPLYRPRQPHLPPPPAKPDENHAPRATKSPAAEPPPPPPTPSPAPDPSPGDHRPSRTAATPASPTDAAREKRLKGLPRVFHPQALAVGDRPLRETLHALILEICNAREWTTSAELARWFSMHRRSLVQRHLGPLVDAGLLKLRFPRPPPEFQAGLPDQPGPVAAPEVACWIARSPRTRMAIETRARPRTDPPRRSSAPRQVSP